MYLFTRAGRFRPGPIREASTFVAAVTEEVRQETGQEVHAFVATMSPEVGTCAWALFVESLEQLEAVEDKLAVSEPYLRLVEGAGSTGKRYSAPTWGLTVQPTLRPTIKPRCRQPSLQRMQGTMSRTRPAFALFAQSGSASIARPSETKSAPAASCSAATLGLTSEPLATFACQVDAGAYAPCTSPFTSAALANGSHTFRVRATNAGSAGIDQVATRSARSARVRASSSATSSGAPFAGSRDWTTSWQMSSSEPLRPDSASASNSWPASMSRSRVSIRPSV